MFQRLALVTFLFVTFIAGAAWPDSPGPTALGADDLTGQFYRQRGDVLAWSGSPQAMTNARQAVAILSDAASEGLDPERYRVRAAGQGPQAEDAAITAAVMTYMRDIATGRPELRSLDKDVALPARSADFAAMLDDALGHSRLAAMLRDLAPAHAEYVALRAALHRGGDKTDIIAANMERWRWLPPVLEPDRIVINAADAQLEMWLGAKRVLTSRVIVGKPATPTPILRADGAGLTLNPPWTVPRSISAKEILPKLKRNPAWLAGQDMVLLNGPPGDPHGLHVNWRAVRPGTFPYQIRQNPGPRNPLGRIKLELPNRFDVYLHDTPGKAAFNAPVRALSHGCVRVEQILPLASYALKADVSAMQQITEAVGQGNTQYLPLQRKLPVYFLYWTAMPGPDGEMAFVPDIYGRDQRMIAALPAKPVRMAGNFAACTKG